MRTNKQSHTFTDFYKTFVETTGDDISYAVYVKIVKEVFSLLSECLIDRSQEIELPYAMGRLYVVKYRPKNYNSKSLSVDFVNTKKYNRTIFHLNDHSDGYKYRFFWSTTEYRIKHKKSYQLVMSRANKRRLAFVVKNKLNDYIEI